MSGTTISSTTTTGVRLTVSSQNPLVITSSGSVLASGAYAAYSAPSVFATITNYGELSATMAGSTGIIAAAGAIITNQTLGQISGAANGIYVNTAAASIVNAGSIQGAHGIGIELQAGGTVANGPNGLIGGYFFGVDIAGGGTIVNQSRIVAASTFGSGIDLHADGTITNTSTGTIAGGTYGAYVAGGSTVINSGSIGGAHNSGLAFSDGGNLTNASTGTITGHYSGVTIRAGYGHVNDQGVIQTSSGDGLSMAAGGYVVVGLGGAIQGSSYGVAIGGGSGTLANAGVVSSTDKAGAGLSAGGLVNNLLLGTITGYLGVSISGGTGTVDNHAAITATGDFGVRLASGGIVFNAATGTIKSLEIGVDITAGTGAVTNQGLITGVVLNQGGSLLNGSVTNTTASVIGAGGPGVSIYVGAAAVSNFGTILGGNGGGVAFAGISTGQVVNGSTADTTALIAGTSDGIAANGHVPVFNFARIHATTGAGVFLGQASSVTNGSTADTSALIAAGEHTSGTGIFAISDTAPVNNFGTIWGGYDGIDFSASATQTSVGTVINGSAADTAALIEGGLNAIAASSGLVASNFGDIVASSTAYGTAIAIGSGVGHLTNWGTIDGGNTGIDFGGNGTVNSTGAVNNGSASDTTALIAGGQTGISADGLLAIANFATISAGDIGILFNGNGTQNSTGQVTNGSTSDTTALIAGGQVGISENGFAHLVNFATIQTPSGTGIALSQGGIVTNGSSADTEAAINGGTGTGVYVGLGNALISNFGTVQGGSDAIQFSGNGIQNSTGEVINGTTSDTTALIAGATDAVDASGPIAVDNFATINATATYGVVLAQGGSVTNGTDADTTASITAGSSATGTGIIVDGGIAFVSNSGTISGGNDGVNFAGGALETSTPDVVNGSTSDTTALISGTVNAIIAAGPVNVTNFADIAGLGATNGIGINAGSGLSSVSNWGTIRGGNTGVNFGTTGYTFGSTGALAGGTVINGSTSDLTALIAASRLGISAAGPTTVENFGTIQVPTGVGILLGEGGNVMNGTATDTTASIIATAVNGVYGSGVDGIYVGLGGAAIRNFGTIVGRVIGIDLAGAGTLSTPDVVLNGSTADTNALIKGSSNGLADIRSTLSVINFATIWAISRTATGVFLGHGGNVTNGSASDTDAAIIAASGTIGAGVIVHSGTAAINNYGTLWASNSGAEFDSSGGVNSTGEVTNGSNADTVALILAHTDGIVAAGSVTVTNFAAIRAITGSDFYLGQGGQVTNGTASDTAATIFSDGTSSVCFWINAGSASIANWGEIESAGSTAILFAPGGTMASTGTVFNAGTISTEAGKAGTAIQFDTGDERLILRPGSSIIGQVLGGSGTNTLELTVGGPGTIGAIGSAFVNFGTVDVDPNAAWTLQGANTTGTVTNSGALTLAAGATLQVTGGVDPASSGVFVLNNSSVLEVFADQGASDKMSFLGHGKVIIDQAANFGIGVGTTAYAGPLIEKFGTGDNIDLKDVPLAGAILNYSTTTGLLQISVGTVDVATFSFQSSSLGSGTFHTANDGTGHLWLTHS